MKTTPVVVFGQNGIAIKDDAAFSLLTGALQSFSDFEDISNSTSATKPYATYEPDYWLLDGNYKIMPTTGAHVGIMGNTLSTSPNGDFGTLIDITIDFDTVHSTSGMSFVFSYSGDWLDTITIAFYNSSFVLIRSDVYHPAGETFSTGQAVSNFKRIHILMNSTNKVFRYPRINRIDFDNLTRFTGAEIKYGRVIQEINPLSTELSIDSLELDLFSSDGDFSIVDPSGFFENLQYKEPLDVYEDVNGETLYIGRFYLDKWESINADNAHFEASCAIALLDKPLYLGGLFDSPNTDSDALVLDIMNTAGVSYEMDSSLNNITIDGFLELYATCREALQQVLFYIGAYATCARSNVIQIRPLELASSLTSYDHTLTSVQKGISSPLSLKPLVTGIELHKFEFFSDNDVVSEELYNASLGTGSHTIVLGQGSKMPSNLTLGGSATYSITLNRHTFVVINVTGAGTVVLTQTEGETILEQIEGVYNGSLPAGTPENVITIEDAKIVTTSALVGGILASTIATRIYNYYQQRYLQKTRLYASLLAPGDSVLVDVQSSRQLKGIVERMETDLTGGYVSDVEIIGVLV